jgi:hypothetical protein
MKTTPNTEDIKAVMLFISSLPIEKQIQLFEFIRDLLNLRTVTDYAKSHGHSYNGIDKGKNTDIRSVTVAGKKFIIDRQ